MHTTAGELVQKLVGDKVEEGAVVAECQEQAERMKAKKNKEEA